MKTKTIKAILNCKFKKWTDSLPEDIRKKVEKTSIITGGSIVSMLLNEEANDFDIYFTNIETVTAIANHYVSIFNSKHGTTVKVDMTDQGRVRIVCETGHRGETVGNPDDIASGSGEIEDQYSESESAALKTESVPPDPFRPVFLSTNAITLSGKIQLVLRFYGEPENIHENYDFVHCTNYWTSKDNQLVLRQEALESILAKELRYMGSKYPVASVMRIRKFISRGWTINAGQVLKMLLQISTLNLMDVKVLEDQLTGVDSAYFIQLVDDIRDKDPSKLNASYLCEIINRLF